MMKRKMDENKRKKRRENWYRLAPCPCTML
jgi:hypothetical protein